MAKKSYTFACDGVTAVRHVLSDDDYTTLCGCSSAGPTEDEPALYYDHELDNQVDCPVCMKEAR